MSQKMKARGPKGGLIKTRNRKAREEEKSERVGRGAGSEGGGEKKGREEGKVRGNNRRERKVKEGKKKKGK